MAMDTQLERFRKRRDEASFLALYDAHTGYLWGMARRLTAWRDGEAEEIVQETWLRVVSRLADFRGDSSLRSWLGGILLNCWRERRRELAREQNEPPATPLAALAAPTIPAVATAIDLERALASLPEGMRAVVVLHDLFGFTHAEIATQLDLAVGTSKSRLFAARRVLAEHLGSPRGTRPDSLPRQPNIELSPEESLR